MKEGGGGGKSPQESVEMGMSTWSRKWDWKEARQGDWREGAKKRLKQRGARISVRWEVGRFLPPFHRNIDTWCFLCTSG